MRRCRRIAPKKARSIAVHCYILAGNHRLTRDGLDDKGQTWSPPAQIADRGVCPNAITMSNGILVCTYSRPGNWLIFSDDHGKTWKGAFQFGSSGATNYIHEVAPDMIQVYYEVKEGGEDRVRGTFFTVKKKVH